MSATTGAGSALDAAAKQKALDQVLASETFARSGRLRELLRFLCEAEMAGRDRELTEYSIGTQAMGRPDDFSPLEDSCVRSRTYELRQKLEKFYAQEAPLASPRIELRKGSYVPRFFIVEAEPEPAPGPAPAVLPLPAFAPPDKAPPPTRRGALWMALAFAGGIAATELVHRSSPLPAPRPATGGWTPDLETLWRPFIDTTFPTLLVVETRFFIHMGPLMVRDWRVNSLAGVEQSEPLMRMKRLFGVQQLYGTPNYTDAGNPRAMFYLTRLLAARVPNMMVKDALETSADDFRNHNVILLGKPGMDPDVERVLARGEMVDRDGSISIVHPDPGQPAEYRDRADPTDPQRWSEKYSVITMMAGPSGGNRILSLTGSGSQHPAALAYYMTNAETVRELVEKVPWLREPKPASFQILVRAEFKSTSITRVSFLGARKIKA